MSLRSFAVLGRVGLATTLLGLTVGCSYVYDVQFTVGVPAGTTAPLIVEVLDSHGRDERNVVVPSASQTVVMATVSVCCAPNPVVTMRAYLDLNNNMAHDVGEPLDVWPGGPVRLTGTTLVQLHLPTQPAAPTPAVTAPSAPEGDAL